MSGGEPSSIKRIVLCAAASLHTYVSDFFGSVTMQFLKRLLQAAGYILPILCFFIFVTVIGCLAFELPVLYMQAALVIGICMAAACAIAVALGETAAYRRNSTAGYIAGDSFKGFSRASRLFASASAELADGFFDDALEDFKEVEEMDISEHDRAVLCFCIGSCYQAMGYPTNAGKYFELSIEHGIGHDFVYILAARCCVANGSFSKAMEYYNTLLDKGCMYDYIYTDMGMCRLKEEKPDEALELFQKSIGEGKNYAFALGGCSLSYLMKKDLEKSRDYFARALVNNLTDIDGFRQYYCSVAESVGCMDQVDDYMKKAARSAADSTGSE